MTSILLHLSLEISFNPASAQTLPCVCPKATLKDLAPRLVLLEGDATFGKGSVFGVCAQKGLRDPLSNFLLTQTQTHHDELSSSIYQGPTNTTISLFSFEMDFCNCEPNKPFLFTKDSCLGYFTTAMQSWQVLPRPHPLTTHRVPQAWIWNLFMENSFYSASPTSQGSAALEGQDWMHALSQSGSNTY